MLTPVSQRVYWVKYRCASLKLTCQHFQPTGPRHWMSSTQDSPSPPARAISCASKSIAEKAPATDPAGDPIVQYVVLRKDLWAEQQWPLGPLLAQACHASSAAIWLSKDDEITATYCAPENLDDMHKVVLEAKGEAQLRNLADKLEEAGIVHKLWIEQPENYPTCLATKPYRKSQAGQHFKKFQLCKAPVGVPPKA